MGRLEILTKSAVLNPIRSSPRTRTLPRVQSFRDAGGAIRIVVTNFRRKNATIFLINFLMFVMITMIIMILRGKERELNYYSWK